MTIKDKQNTNEILELQYLAKYSYNKASTYNILAFLLMIISVGVSGFEEASIQLGLRPR